MARPCRKLIRSLAAVLAAGLFLLSGCSDSSAPEEYVPQVQLAADLTYSRELLGPDGEKLAVYSAALPQLQEQTGTEAAHINDFYKNEMTVHEADCESWFGIVSQKNYPDTRTNSFEWKDMGGTGDAGYPLLYNDIWSLLKDATGYLWSDEWQVGYTAELQRKYYGTHITTAITVTDAGTVTTAAGSFTGCICLAIDVQGLEGGWRYRGGKKEYYFAPGVGIVRQVCHFKKQTLTATYDLVEYTGTGEGFFPLCDGFFRRYAAQDLTDGYIGEAEYTCAARDDGGLVVLENRTGIQRI